MTWSGRWVYIEHSEGIWRLVSTDVEPVTFNIKPANTKLNVKAATIEGGVVAIEEGAVKVTLNPELESMVVIDLA